VVTKVQPGDWVLLTENPEEVLAALERGESDGILPAVSGVMDLFAKFLSESGIPRVLDGFADYRSRRSIAPFLFCNLLLHKSVFNIDSLSRIGPFLFSSPDTLRALGFNMRQIQEGFYSGSAQRPLNVEAVGDFFAACRPQDFQANQKEVLIQLLIKHPELLEEGTLVMDCIDVRIPPGNRSRAEQHLEMCVICCLYRGECLPLLWSIIDAATQADITQGKALVDDILPIVEGRARRLIVDRGFLSGKWMSDLKQGGIDTVIGLKTDMVIYTDMVSLASDPETIWLKADLPKYTDTKSIPLSRHIAYLGDLETWETCGVTLAGIVIRDIYADKVVYQCVVTTDLEAEPEQIHSWIRSRWGIEETFMRDSRYGSFNKIGPCRVGIGIAIAHFSLLSFTLLRLFADQEQPDDEKTIKGLGAPFGGVELVVYWKDYYAIVLMSELMTIMAKWPPDTARRAQKRQSDFEQALLRSR
jgi:hypothetical protein